MSTKNLARTVIEGGRARYNRHERWCSNSAERRHAHQREHALRRAEADDDAYFEPRRVVSRDFHDKLNPGWRWLCSQVGRPWDKVRSELFARFDTRTTAGRHILFDHLLAEVSTDPIEPYVRYARAARFRVSRHGLLQYVGRERYTSNRPSPLPELEGELRAWLGSRRVARHGQRLYWLHRTEHDRFRQERELTEHEVARFERLPDWFREAFEGWNHAR